MAESSTEEIYNEFGKELNLVKCDFEEILLDDIPQGTGLTFIAIARAVVDIPASFIFAILFYALITMLGIGSMLGTLEGVLTPVVDAMQVKISRLASSHRQLTLSYNRERLGSKF